MACGVHRFSVRVKKKQGHDISCNEYVETYFVRPLLWKNTNKYAEEVISECQILWRFIYWGIQF